MTSCLFGSQGFAFSRFLLQLGQPELIASVLRTGTWWWPALRKTVCRLKDTSLWAVLPATEAQSSLVFQTLTRTMAAIYEYCIMRFRAYPLKLVDLVSGGADKEMAVATFLSVPDCVLDPFSLSYRQAHPTPEALSDPKACATLRLFLAEVSGSTYDVECTHSRNLRKMRSRTMTHNIDVSDLSLGLAAVSAPAVLAPMLRVAQDAKKMRDKGARRKKLKRRGGGGGAWRAYVHKKGQCQPGQPRTGRRCQLRSLALEYSQLSQADKQSYKEAGKMATRRHKEGSRSFPATWLQACAANDVSPTSLLPAQAAEVVNPVHVEETGADAGHDEPVSPFALPPPPTVKARRSWGILVNCWSLLGFS